MNYLPSYHHYFEMKVMIDLSSVYTILSIYIIRNALSTILSIYIIRNAPFKHMTILFQNSLSKITSLTEFLSFVLFKTFFCVDIFLIFKILYFYIFSFLLLQIT